MENRSNYTSNKTSENLNRSSDQKSKWLLPVVLTLALITGFALFMSTNDNNLENIEPAGGYSSTTFPENVNREDIDR